MMLTVILLISLVNTAGIVIIIHYLNLIDIHITDVLNTFSQKLFDRVTAFLKVNIRSKEHLENKDKIN